MIDDDSKNWPSILLRVRGSVVPTLMPRILTDDALAMAAIPDPPAK